MTTTNASIAILEDSFAQFYKATYNAFTEVENQSRLEVLCAKDEMREAREEMRKAKEETRKAREEVRKARDETREATLKAQGWKQAAADAKATIAHHVENIDSAHQTIAELQRELSQWKDQARNWQEHFLRVEQDRCAQSSRIDELLKLQYNRHTNTTSFTRTSAAQSDTPTPTTSRTTLIRQVKAVIHVKSEESDDDSLQELSPTLVKNDASDEEDIVQRRSSRRSRKVVNDIGQHHLAADGNPVSESRPLRHRKAVNYRDEDDDDDDDDDDELMMGAEENREEVYGTQRVETLDAQRSKQQPHPTKVTELPRKKKRKLAAR